MASDPGSAAEYWGAFFTGPKPSDMFVRLNLAIIEYARAVNNIDTPALPQNKAYTLLAPQHFFTIMPIFSSDGCPSFVEILKHIPDSFYDSIAVIFYEASDIDHSTKPAYITRKVCRRWMCRVTRAYPDEMHTSLNKLLQSDCLLIDPLTEQKFTFKEIPRSCFPSTPDLELKTMYKEKGEGVDTKMVELVRQISAASQAAQSSAATSQQREALARAELAAAEQRRIALLGETYYDNHGKKMYREGAFDSLDRANY